MSFLSSFPLRAQYEYVIKQKKKEKKIMIVINEYGYDTNVVKMKDKKLIWLLFNKYNILCYNVIC